MLLSFDSMNWGFIRMRFFRTRPRARVGLLAALTVALTGGVIAAPLAATAADGTPSDVSSQIVGAMTVTNAVPGDPDTNVYDSVKVDFALSTKNAADPTVDEGDFFTIRFASTVVVPNATLNLMGGDEVMATCVAVSETNDIRCVLTAAAADRQWVEGTLSVTVMVDQAVGETTFDVTVGDKVIVGTFPGGPVGPVAAMPWPTTSKWGWQLSENPDQLRWFVGVRSDEVPAGAPVIIEDELSGPTTLIGAPDIELRTYVDEADWNADGGTIVTVPLGLSTQTISPGVTTQLALENLSDQSFRLTFGDAMPDTALYVVSYRSQIAEGTLSGQVFSNTANVSGTEVTDRSTYIDRIAGDLNGPGTGGLVISKLLSGDAADLGVGKAFTVNAAWTDAAGAAQERALTVVGDGAGAQLTGLPTGTVVTLSELTTTAIDGATYVPTFSSASPGVEVSTDGTTATVTIGDRATASIVVTNALTPVVTPTPTRTPTPTTTPSVVPTTPAPGLAATGADVAPWIPALAVIALVAGAVLVARKRTV